MGKSSNHPVDISVDLRSSIETNKAIKSFFTHRQAISVVVCNAGSGRPPHQLSQEDWPRYFEELNLHTAQNLISSVLDFLVPGDSSIVAISSIAAMRDLPNAPKGYGESKRKLNSLMTTLALQYADKRIRFNTLTLGNVIFQGSRWSEISASNPDFVQNLLMNDVPLGSFISPKEISDAISFLASASAKNITGANLVIDGGQSL
jgi:NAD(P)-dependent dehydrogenase (short-subunit alcohol dehydrogenase family)